MISFIDRLLDRTTMYRLTLYYLIAILAVAVGLALFGLLPYSPLGILVSTFFLVAVCGVTNWVFSKTYEVGTNLESAYVTALILACILPPVRSLHDLPLLFWAGALAMGLKYILAIRGKHVFNPAAIAVVLTAFWLGQPATWWVGTPYMAAVILVGGLLVVRKTRRYAQVGLFFLGALVTSAILTNLSGHDVFQVLRIIALQSSLLFFAFVMLTEPLTSPGTPFLQGVFGLLVGILFAPQLHFGSLYLTPELALVGGNIFSYLVSPKVRQRLTLLSQTYLSQDVLEFEFKPERPFSYLPGQYMEFTLPHRHPDARGTRRYFTLASSPTEETLKLGVKSYPNPSSLKRSLADLVPGDRLMAGQIAGDFSLPRDTGRKLAFIAGGIGVTPFRSMLGYVADMAQARTITLLYMNKTAAEIAYTETFNRLQGKNGIRIVYTLTDESPADWTGRTGRIDEKMVREEIPDFLERDFYLSGPHPMVAGMERILRGMGVAGNRIKKDFFPGLV